MARKSAIPADFVPLSPSLSASLSPKSPTLCTLITQIGFLGDEGMKEEKGVTGGP